MKTTGRLLLDFTAWRLGKGLVSVIPLTWIFPCCILINLWKIYYEQFDYSEKKEKTTLISVSLSALLSWIKRCAVMLPLPDCRSPKPGSMNVASFWLLLLLHPSVVTSGCQVSCWQLYQCFLPNGPGINLHGLLLCFSPTVLENRVPSNIATRVIRFTQCVSIGLLLTNTGMIPVLAKPSSCF